MNIIGLQNRQKGLTCLKGDDGAELILDTEIVASKGIGQGSVIENPQALIYESDLKRAKSRALWYLSRADHSEKNLFDKLVRGGFSKEASTVAVKRMKELGLIDDKAYAYRLAEYLSNNGTSRKELYYKLLNKGIPSSLAKDVLQSDETDETEKIYKLINTKYSKKLESEKGVEKVFAALIRKGFSFSDVRAVLKKYSENIENSEDY